MHEHAGCRQCGSLCGAVFAGCEPCRLDAGKFFLCRFEVPSESLIGMQSGYETPLVVELWYGYSEVEQRDMYIKRVS